MVDGGRGGRSEWYNGASLCGVNGVCIRSHPIIARMLLAILLSQGHIMSRGGEGILILPTGRQGSCHLNIVMAWVIVN